MWAKLEFVCWIALALVAAWEVGPVVAAAWVVVR